MKRSCARKQTPDGNRYRRATVARTTIDGNRSQARTILARSARRARIAACRPAWRLRIEVGIVLGLSLGASAVYSIVSLVAKLTESAAARRPVASRSTRRGRAANGSTSPTSSSTSSSGCSPSRSCSTCCGSRGAARSAASASTSRDPAATLASGLAARRRDRRPGLALYALGRALGLTVAVVRPHRSTRTGGRCPILVFAALEAALTEEVIVVGYLFTRLRELGVGPVGDDPLERGAARQLPPVPGVRAVLRQRRDGHRLRLVLRALGPHDAARHRALDARHRCRSSATRWPSAGGPGCSRRPSDGRRRMPRARRRRGRRRRATR